MRIFKTRKEKKRKEQKTLKNKRILLLIVCLFIDLIIQLLMI